MTVPTSASASSTVSLPSGTLPSPWAATMPLANLNQVVSVDPALALSDQQADDPQRFWATDNRPATSQTTEVLQITLGVQRLINTIEFDVSHFPCSITIEYYDTETNIWQPCLDSTQTTPTPITAGVQDSVPAVLPPVSSVGGHLHPQHSFSGHWETLELTVQPFYATNIRLLLTRISTGSAPTDNFGNLVDYSLAVRRVLLGYTVTAQSDIPSPPGVFASTTDLLGSPVSYTLRVDSADNVLRNASSTTSTSAGGTTTSSASSAAAQQVVWKCEPQPVPWAVVNFYIDVRDDNANAQVVDRLYVDPLYTGPSMNLYYSNDDPSGAFTPGFDPLPNGVVIVNDEFGLGGNILYSGAAGIGDIAFVDINNNAIGFDPTHSWWFGGLINAKYAHDGSEVIDHPILDAGVGQFCLTPLGFLFSTSGGDYLSIPLDDFDPATPITFVVSYDGVDTVTAWLQIGPTSYTGSVSITTEPLPVQDIRVGGFQGDEPGVSDIDFTELVLKVDDVPDLATVQAFLNNPDPYILNAPYLASQSPLVDNALLRYHIDFVDVNLNPAGFVGGPADRYADLSWTPITRDYTLQKGYCNFFPISAKYLKLEFSGLVPEVYEIYEPISRNVQTFPVSMWPTVGNSPAPVNQQAPGTTANWQASLMLAAQQYTGGSLPIVGTGGLRGKNYTATTARIITNLNQQTTLALSNWTWRFLPSSSPVVMPSFTATGTHTYEQIDITQTTKLAYFVGLKTVGVYRLDYSTTADTDEYIDLFYDTNNLAADTNFILEQSHALSSGAADYAEAQSVVFNSQRVVAAIQFATSQSDPTQYLPDDGFDDPTHTNWTPVGDASFAPGVVENQVVGSTLQISRDASGVTWTALTAQYPTFQAAMTLNVTYASIMAGFSVPESSGGVTSGTITSPPGGRVYAAARVIAPAALTSPLYVQIVDDDTGQVLSEEAATVAANTVTEWYTGYHIGDGVDPVPLLWSDFSAPNTAVPMEDNFTRANSPTLGEMTSTQVWSYDLDNNGNPTSLSIVDDAAQSTLQGDHSYVNTESLWGSVEFSVDNAISNTAVQGPNILSNGTFDSGTISPWTAANATLSLSASGMSYSGEYSLKVTPNSSVTSTVIASEQYLAVQPGATYNLDFRAWFTNATTMFGFGLVWFDTNHNSLSSSTTSMSASGGVWTNSTLTAVAPSGAVYMTVNATLAGSPPPSDVWYVDSAILTTGAEAYVVKVGSVALDISGELLMTSGSAFEAPNASVLVPGGSGTQSILGDDDIRIDSMPTFLVPSGMQDVTQTVDPVATPYSLVIYRNNSWVRTVSHDRGTLPLVGLKGNQGQEFGSFAYTPLRYGGTPTDTISGLPTGSNGGWANASINTTTWIDRNGNQWTATGTWNPSGMPKFPGRDDCGTPLIATSNGSTFTTDVESYYGAMTTHVSTLAGASSGQGASPHGNVLVLDYEHGMYVDVNGNILVNGINYGNLFPGGIPIGKNVTVQWLPTARVSSATLGGINASQYPDMIVGKVAGVIVGRFAHANLAIWRGTQRGVAGDSYNGTPPSWTSEYQNNTVFRAWVWAPDASNIAVNPTEPTWDTVTQDGSLTYDAVMTEAQLVNPNLRAQVVQYGESQDVWDIDALSLFVDPIVWSFSTDGGYTFYPAYEIKNNPQGVLAFPQSIVVTQLGQLPGTGLVWKVVSYAPNSIISSLVIRPWYSGLLSGNNFRVGLSAQGPNVMPYDHFGDIANDAAFQTWDQPIPRDWFFAYRSLTSAALATVTGGTYPGNMTYPDENLYPGSS
jgi:Carbohydrate binding domain